MAEKSKTFSFSGGVTIESKPNKFYMVSDLYLAAGEFCFSIIEFESINENPKKHFIESLHPEVLKKNRQDFIEWAGDAIWKKEVKNEG